MPSVNAIILDSDALKTAVNWFNSTANPGKPVSPSAHWMQVVLRNATQFAMIPTGDYLVACNFNIKPSVIGAFSIGQFVAQSDGAGSTGGAAFFMLLDATGVSQPIAVGFADPIIGAYKGAVILSDSAEEGYDASNNKGTHSLHTEQYSGTTSIGSNINFQFQLSAEVSPNCVIVSITQTA